MYKYEIKVSTTFSIAHLRAPNILFFFLNNCTIQHLISKLLHLQDELFIYWYLLIILSWFNHKCDILIAIRTTIPKIATLFTRKFTVRHKPSDRWGTNSQKHSILGLLSEMFKQYINMTRDKFLSMLHGPIIYNFHCTIWK